MTNLTFSKLKGMLSTISAHFRLGTRISSRTSRGNATFWLVAVGTFTKTPDVGSTTRTMPRAAPRICARRDHMRTSITHSCRFSMNLHITLCLLSVLARGATARSTLAHITFPTGLVRTLVGEIAQESKPTGEALIAHRG
jgi:hypothetical protein